MANLYEYEQNIDYNGDNPMKFSDDEDEYNYYTGSDDEEFEAKSSYSAFRAFATLLVSILF